MKQIAVIGRALSNSRFDNLWSILEEAKNEEILDYQGYSIDNNKNVTKDQLEEYHAFIYIGCKPVIEDDRPYIRFTNSAEGDEFINKITELNEKLFGEEEVVDTIDNIPPIMDILDDSTLVGGQEIDGASNMENISSSDNSLDVYTSDSGTSLILEEQSKEAEIRVPEEIQSENQEDRECDKIQKLKGFIIEINNKQACLSIDDIDKLKELCLIIEKQQFKIVNIVVE